MRNEALWLVRQVAGLLMFFALVSACAVASTTTAGPSRIAFVSEREGSPQVYSIAPDGSNMVRVTDLEGGVSRSSVTWAPDGRRLVFFVDSGNARRGSYGEPLGVFDMYTVNADGTSLSRIATQVTDYVAWSPDSKRIAFETDRDGNMDVYVMDRDGSNVKNLTNDPGWDNGPIWSPDGKRIAFTARRGASDNFDLWLMDSDGSHPMQVTDVPGYDWPIGWTRERDKLLISSTRDDPVFSDSQLYLVDTRTWRATNITNTSQNEGDAVLSPDRKRVAYVSSYDTRSSELAVMDLGSRERRVVFATQAIVSSPTWSPDGKQLAFQVTERGNADIYVADTDVSDLRRVTKLTDNPEDDMAPAWSP